MDTGAIAQITLHHRITTQGLAGLIPGDALDELRQRHFDTTPLSWVELTADLLNAHPCERIQQQATELWLVHRLSDAEVEQQVLPLLSSNAAFDLCPDNSQRLALWRSLYQPLIQHHRHALTQPQPEPALPSRRLDSSGLRSILSGHFGNRVIDLMEKANRLHMVNSASDLPESIRARHSQLLNSIAGATFGDGTVYLVADKIAPQKAAAIFLHEVGEHAGMATMLGKDYGRLVQQFRRLLARGDSYATWAAMRVPRSTPAAHVPSEQLAYLVEKVATDQQPDPAGIEGHALGKECLSHLRGWLFRTPLMSWLDTIGEADHFTLNPEDIAALARQAVDDQARSLTDAPLEKNQASAWIEALEPDRLDTLFRCNARQRRMVLAESAPEALAGYLYALKVARARDIDETIDDYIPALARMAAGEHGDHLTVIAGELMEYAASREPVRAFRAQMGEGGIAMFRSTASDGTPTLRVITGNADDELLTVRHFKQGVGYVMHEMLDRETVEASLTGAVLPVQQADYGAVLAEHAQVKTAQASSRLDQWRKQAEATVQPMFTTGSDGLVCVRGCDAIHLPAPLREQLGDKPVAISLSNPAINQPRSHLISASDLTRTIGATNARMIVLTEESAVYESASWQQLAESTGATTVAELMDSAPDRLGECEIPAALVFNNPRYRALFVDAGYDGAIYGTATHTGCTLSHAFTAQQIAPYSRFGALETNDGMEGIATRFDAYQRAYWDYQTEEAKELSGAGNVDALFDASTRMAESQEALADAMGSSSFVCIAGSRRSGEQVFLTPSAKQRGWQITHLGDDGQPISDTLHLSKEEACADLLRAIVPNSLRLHADTGVVLRPNGREVEATAPQVLAEVPRNTFAGESAHGASIDKLEKAKELLEQGRPAINIHAETGWFRGFDGKWRYEISDDQADFRHVQIDLEALKQKILPDVTYSVTDNGLVRAAYQYDTPNYLGAFGRTEIDALEALAVHYARNHMDPPFDIEQVKAGDNFALMDVLDHPELFAAYPYLKHTIVEFQNDDQNRGAFYEHQNLITLNLNRPKDEMLSTLLHEIQHSIQAREMFARGGNADSSFTGSIRQMLQELHEDATVELEVWKRDNQNLIDDADAAAEVAQAALMYQAVQSLIRYANRDAPSGVFRLIRNELGWNYHPVIQDNPTRRAKAREIDYMLADLPRRGPRRNAGIRAVCETAIDLYLECIPSDLLKQFRNDERTLKGMVKAMQREAQKKNDLLEPMQAMKRDVVGAEALFRRHKFNGPFDIYQSLAGEVESRMTQKRQHLTAEQRTNRFPMHDSDVNPSDVIVYYRGSAVHLPSLDISASKLDQTETPEFKDWFGDSKVVDADGKPLVVYHGTVHDFSEFDPSTFGSSTDAGTEGQGFYFLTSPAAASSNAEWVSDWGERSGANVMPVYLAIENPYRISKSTAPRGLEGNPEAAAKFTQDLIRQGYDGVEYTLMDGGKSYVAFRPEQIKSAIGNRGTFDPANPDIRYSLTPSATPVNRAYTPSYHMQGWIEQTGLPPATIEQYARLGEQQRRQPQAAMIAAQKLLGATNPLAPAIEHIGDLTYRMSPKHSVAFAFEETREQIERQLRILKGGAGFRQEYEQALAQAADHQGISLDEHKRRVDKALKAYADAHDDLNAHAPLQRMARDAAIALGRGRFEKATRLLEDMLSRMQSLPEFIHELGGHTGQTRTQEFDQWFGDSQIIDEHGRPLVLYHGTNGDFTVFNPDASREGDQTLFATTSHSVASAFALYRSVWEGANVMPIYVKADRVLQVEGGYRPIREVEASPGLDGMQDGESLRDFARRMGYDAINIRNTDDQIGPSILPASDIYILLPSAQIKSAIGNIGTFDPSNPDIRFSRTGVERAAQDRVDGGDVAFSEWFADSKIVDAEGKPLVVYHGSFTDITEFKPQDNNSMMGRSIYLSSNPEDASRYASDDSAINFDITGKADKLAKELGISYSEARELVTEGNGVVYPLYVRMVNPFIIGNELNTATEPEFMLAAAEADVDAEEAARLFRRWSKATTGHEQFDALSRHPNIYRGIASLRGHDGIIMRDGLAPTTSALRDSTEHYIVFNGEQLRFAIGHTAAYLRSDDEARAGTSASADKAFNPELISEMEVPAYKSREKLIDMPIADFLMLARDGYEEEKAASVKKLLDNGTQFNSLPYLRIDLDGRVDGHEGRHRARALAAQGHTTMPVILHMADLRWSQQADPNLRDYVTDWPTTIQAEVGAINPDLKLPFPVTREQATQPYQPAGAGATAATNQTDTPAFKRWFGDSKIVDAEGKPLVVYHGTASDFSAFSKQVKAKHIDLPGFYFTPFPEYADRYAESAGRKFRDEEGFIAGSEGANVMPVYLSLQNPAIIDVGGANAGLLASFEIEEMINSAKFDGHDGVILKGWGDGSGPIQYIAFRSEQIKSAIGNNGNFDPDNDDIRFSASTEPNRDEPVALTETPAFRNWFGGSKVVLANGQPMPVYHGTTSTNYVPAVRQDGSSSARAELERIAAAHGIKDWTSAPAVLERWVRSGMAERFGVTEQDAIHARKLMTMASSTEVAPSRVELGFDVFAMPEGDLELGSHFGTEAQAENFGDSFEFFIRIENPLRLPDLGNWDYLAVMHEARNSGVPISDTEHAAVVEANNRNAALRSLLASKGYDGIVYENEAEGAGDSYIVFDPEQIMSASQAPAPATLHASDRFHLQDSPDIELATHMPVATDLRYQRAKALLPVLKTHLDVKFVNDSYGSWIDIQENIWVNGQHGGENVGQVSHGVAFINGELYELDPSAYFYHDSEPFWSPVVQADNEAVAKLYEALTGKRYPIFDAGTGEPEAHDRLIRLKAEKGFVHSDGAFIHSSEYEKWINGPPEMLERESAAAFNADIRFTFAGTGAVTHDLYTLALAQEQIQAGIDPELVRQQTGWHQGVDGKWRYEISDADARIRPAAQWAINEAQDELLLAQDKLARAEAERDAIIRFYDSAPANPPVAPASTPEYRGAEDRIDDAAEAVREAQERVEALVARGLRVGDVLDHPALFAAYPSLADTRLSFRATDSVGAAYYPGADLIVVDSRVNGELASILTHELQHAIQAKEGFARGGTEQEFQDRDTTDEYIAIIQQQISDILSANPALRELHRQRQQALAAITEQYGEKTGRATRIRWEAVPDTERTAYMALTRELASSPEHQAIAELESARFYAERDRVITPAHQQYHRLAGEVEARNVVTRMGMTDDQRQQVAPGRTQDTPDEDVIVLFNGEAMASAPLPQNARPNTTEPRQATNPVFDFTPPLDGNVIREYKLGDTRISLSISSMTDEVSISSIRTPRAKRGRGSARAAMEQLIAQADAEQVVLTLGASPLDNRTNLTQLISFYESLGFGDSGRKVNMLGHPVMGRSPRRPGLNAQDKANQFLQKFAGSKVVDEQGRPLVLYHGTRPGNDIEQFMVPNHDGVYFTPDIDYAESYTDGLFDDKGTAGPVYPVYVDLKNPYIVRSTEGTEQWDQFIYRGLDREALQAQGYDGAMLYHEEHGLDQVVAFDSNQITFAIGLQDALDQPVAPASVKIDQQVQAPEFKAWFDNSHVVTADGEPLRVYHGTARDFRVFSADFQGDTFADLESAIPRDGFWFTSDPASASWYANQSARSQAGDGDASGQRILPVYLSLQNPFYYTVAMYAEEGRSGIPSQSELESQGYDGLIIEVPSDDEPETPEADAMWEQYTPIHGSPLNWPADLRDEYNRLLDTPPMIDRMEYVAFRPEQIVSAISSSSDLGADLRFSRVQGNEQPLKLAIRPSDLALAPEELTARDRMVPPNGTTPAEPDDLPLGSIRLPQYGGDIEDRYVSILTEVPVGALLLSEPEDRIRSHPSFARYVQWAKDGLEAPAVAVNQTPEGHLISVNRRRVLAAREAGISSIRAWVSPINPVTGDPLKYRDILAMVPGQRLTAGLAAAAAPEPEATAPATAADSAVAALGLLDAIRVAYDDGELDKVDELTDSIESLIGDMDADAAMAAQPYDEDAISPATEYLARAYADALRHPGAGPDINRLRASVIELADHFGGLRENVDDGLILASAEDAYEQVRIPLAGTSRPRFSPELEHLLYGEQSRPQAGAQGLRVDDVMFHNAISPMLNQFGQWSQNSHVVNEKGAPKVVFAVEPMGSTPDANEAAYLAGTGSKRFMDFDTAWAEAEANLTVGADGLAQPYQITPAYLSLKRPVPGMNGHQTTASFSNLASAMGVDAALALVAESGQEVPMIQTGTGPHMRDPNSQIEIAPILDSPRCIRMLKEAGYDGAAYAVAAKDGSVRTEYRVFTPDQVLAGCPMAVITTDNAGDGLRFSISASITNHQGINSQPSASEAVKVAIQRSAAELPLSLQLDHLPGLRLSGNRDDIDQHLAAEVQSALIACNESVDELEGRIKWLGRSHEGGRHYEKTAQKLEQVKAEQRQLQRWAGPSKHTHMPWDKPLGKGLMKALSTVVSLKPGEQVTGKMAVFLAATTHGSIEKGVAKLLKAGIKGIDAGGDVLSWDSANMGLAEHLTMRQQGERFHIAYHGSPHEFDEFDLAYIGSGEGAQAYGRGIYLSDTLRVAGHYQNLTRLHAVYFEETLYPHIDDLIADVVPRICEKYPELAVQPSELHKRLGMQPEGSTLEAPLTHYLRTLAINPPHAEMVLERYPSLAGILKEEGQGLLKYHEQDQDLIVFPRGGMRGINEINAADDNTYRLALYEVESRLNWFVKASSSDEAMAEQFERYLTEIADTEQYDNAIEHIEAKLAESPGDEFYEGQLFDARWKRSQAEAVQQLIQDYGPLKVVRAAPRGTIYMVDIDIVEDQYLHFDKRISAQPESVKVALWNVVHALSEPYQSAAADLINADSVASEVYEAMHQHHSLREAPGSLNAVQREDALARQLNSAGIHGIKYEDGLTQRGGGEGEKTYNYVVFDTARMTIVGRTNERNPEPEHFEPVDASEQKVRAGMRMR